MSLELEEIACPLCGADDHRPWGSEKGFSGVKCLNCALVYVTPRPKASAISKTTHLGAHETELGQLAAVYRPNWTNGAMYRRDLASAFDAEITAAQPLDWLDIGAGYGEFITVLNGALPPGSTVLGVKPMRVKASYAQSNALNVIESLPTTPNSYDVISLMNVFSHIPDCRAFLGNIVPLLRPTGTIFLRTGNGGDLDRRSSYPDKLDFPDHLVFAGRAHLDRFLEELGFLISWRAERRLDIVTGVAKAIVKRVMARPTQIGLPYTSPFRDVRIPAVRSQIS